MVRGLSWLLVIKLGLRLYESLWYCCYVYEVWGIKNFVEDLVRKYRGNKFFIDMNK